MRLCFGFRRDRAPEAFGVSGRKQRLHIYDRLSQGDLHVRWFSDRERLHRNVERSRFLRATTLSPASTHQEQLQPFAPAAQRARTRHRLEAQLAVHARLDRFRPPLHRTAARCAQAADAVGVAHHGVRVLVVAGDVLKAGAVALPRGTAPYLVSPSWYCWSQCRGHVQDTESAVGKSCRAS